MADNLIPRIVSKFPILSAIYKSPMALLIRKQGYGVNLFIVL